MKLAKLLFTILTITLLLTACGPEDTPPGGTALPTNVSVGQHDALLPLTPEQVAAAQAFDEYVRGKSVQYRNARYETISNDGTFVDVFVTMEVYEPAEAWVEKSAVITLRLVGGSWKADTSSINLTLTRVGQATLEAIHNATQQAAESAAATAAAATAVSLQTNLGGTLIYALSGSSSIAIRTPDGHETIISPFPGMYPKARYENLELAPSGNGIYFAADTASVTPAIFYMNLDGSNSTLLIQFRNQTKITDISVSPDNSKLAVLTGSFAYGPDRIWIVPTSGGEGFIIWEGHEGWLSASSWAPDSSSLYVNILSSNPTKGTIVNLQMDGSSKTIAELPVEAITENYFLVENALSASPDGNDIAFGGGILGLLRISNASKVKLSEIAPVCNPTWSSGGDRLVFASGNSILVFNLASGEVTNPYSLPVSKTDFIGCPLSFDWIP